MTATSSETSLLAAYALDACTCICEMPAAGGRVAVQLFHTRLEGLASHLSHVLGIREETEGQQAQHPPDFLGLGVRMSPAQVFKLEDIISLSSGASECLVCSHMVDAATLDLTLLKCSSCCTAISGHMCLKVPVILAPLSAECPRTTGTTTRYPSR